jgi:hypothetical protein
MKKGEKYIVLYIYSLRNRRGQPLGLFKTRRKANSALKQSQKEFDTPGDVFRGEMIRKERVW